MRAVNGAGQFSERLAHKAGLQTDMGVTHLAFDLRTRNECGNRVDNDNIYRIGPDQGLGNLQGLFTGVGLRNNQFVRVYTETFGVGGVQSVFCVDKSGNTA